MDKSKAKKAVKKSTDHKKQAEAQAAEAMLAMKAAGGGDTWGADWVGIAVSAYKKR